MNHTDRPAHSSDDLHATAATTWPGHRADGRPEDRRDDSPDERSDALRPDGSSPFRSVVALSGGVGGARMLDGLARALPPGALTAIVNTGDDFVHWGLTISPDLDTVMYTLAGMAHEARGWGLAEESFNALEMVGRYGGPAWFQLGDRDLGTHLMRTMALAAGERLTDITARMCAAVGIRSRVLPMADQPRRTMIHTVSEGVLPFQDWFVGRHAQPEVREVRFEGGSRTTPEVLEAIQAADLVVIGPSNPYVSIDPILTLDGVGEALSQRLVVGVSPIVNGQAVKGPLASMLEQIDGLFPCAQAIVGHYEGLLRGMVVESGDEHGIDLPTLATATIMGGPGDRRRLALELLHFAGTLV